MCKASSILESKEYQQSKEILFKTVEGLDAISRAPFFGSWVLDRDMKLVTMSEQICQSLFNKKVIDCYDLKLNEILKNVKYSCDRDKKMIEYILSYIDKLT